MTRVAYLVSEYAAPSHTFIRREIAALRKRGLTILPFSIRCSSAIAERTAPTVLGCPPHSLVVRAVCMILSSPIRSAHTWLLAQGHRVPGWRGWLWAQFHFIEALVLASMLRAARADRLHSHFANSGATVGMLAANYLGIPWSLTLHGISETDPPAGTLLAGKIERAEFVACASWFMRAQGMRVVHYDLWPKFHIVRCGVDLRPLAGGCVENRPSGIRFLTVGRLSAEKGHPGLLHAFKRLLAAGVDAELVIVGDGPLRDELRCQVVQAGLDERVILRGALPEQETLEEFVNADVFVLASLMEGLPVVLMEAMSLSMPVIAPHVAGIPELVCDGENGLLFPPSDWDSLYERMRTVATREDLRNHLARASRARIEREYDLNVVVQPLIELFCQPGATTGIDPAHFDAFRGDEARSVAR